MQKAQKFRIVRNHKIAFPQRRWNLRFAADIQPPYYDYTQTCIFPVLLVWSICYR
jgi:hypothetical protein